MLPADVRIGWLFRYAYLWNWQHLDGREEGDKDRPCLVLAIVAKDEDGVPIVRVLPVTHTPPSQVEAAVEIPQAAKIRLGLDEERSWIVLTESNRFVWPGPDLRPLTTATGYYGPLPQSLFDEVKRRFVAIARGQTTVDHKSVPRSE